MKERIIQFDLLKGIGILLVLLGHTVISKSVIDWIYGFHMPLFFFSSGFFFKNTPLIDIIKKGFIQLIIPYIFLLIIWNLTFMSVQLISTDMNAYIKLLKENINPIVEDSFWYKTIWFLPCLFIVRMLYAVAQKITKNHLYNLLIGGGYFFDRFFCS